jgi:hypothetical protein
MLLVVTVSPGVYCQRDTIHSLGFGVRARQVARGPAKKRLLATTFNGLISSASTPNLSQTVSRPASPQAKSTTTAQDKKKLSTYHISKSKQKQLSGQSPKFGSMPKFRV